MKAVILKGRHDTRIPEEASIKPKPMVEISGQPVLWHLMRRYPASIRLPWVEHRKRSHE